MSKTENNHKPFQDIEFKSLIIAFKGMLIIFFIVVSLILIFSIKSVAISQDLDYSLEKNIIFNENNPNPIENSTNFRNEQEYTGHYNATYSFENEIIGTSGVDIDFIDSDISTGSCLIEIIDNINGHNYILKFIDYNEGGTLAVGKNSFDNINYGTVEFWILTTDATKDNTIGFSDGAIAVIHTRIDTDQFQYYDGDWHNIGIVPLDNTWYHIKIDFECTSGNYKGLNQYKFKIYINNIEFGEFSFWNDQDHIDTLYIQTAGVDQNYNLYIDAIGYSWDSNYVIGQNLIPYSYPLDNIETANWLFTYDNDGKVYSDGVDNPDTWSDIEAGHDQVNIDVIGFDGFYVIDQVSYGLDIGFHKDDFAIIDGIIEINFTINICFIDTDGTLITNFYSYDSTEILRIMMYPDGVDYKLDYYDGSDYNTLHIFNNESCFNKADFHFFIINDIIIIKMSISEYGVNEMFVFPIIVSGKRGLSEVKVFSDVFNAVKFQRIRYDKIGVYVNGSSIVSDYAWSIYQDYEAHINIDLNYIYFKINASGTFSIGILDISFNYIQLINTYTYSGYNESIKLDISNNLIWINPVMIKIIYNSSYTLEFIYFESYYLKESTNYYFLQFSYSGVDIQENYFYVANNRLYYTHTANQNDTLEYIQAYFNIDNEYTLNSSTNFKAYFLGISKAYFILNFVSQTNFLFDIPIGNTNYNHILPQKQIIKSFTFLITDNDNNDYYGNSEGYFSSIKLLYYPDIELTMLTLSLMEMLIPLLVLIIPTLAISFIYGKKAIIPMLIFMSIICYIAELIELWLLTIMLMCLGSFLFIEYKSERGK